MTKEQFIQQTVISIAGKVIGTNGVAHGFDWIDVIREVKNLADIMKIMEHLEE